MSIKVGQIYKPKNNEDAIFVVTRAEEALKAMREE